MEDAPLEQTTSAGFLPDRHRPKSVGALLAELRPYLLAALGVAIASIIAGFASGAWGTIALLGFVAAVFSAAWYGGFGPSLLATALSFGVLAYYFLKPIGSLAIEEPVDRVIMIVFLVTSVAMGALVGALRATNWRLDALNSVMKAAEEKYRLLFDANPAPICVINPDSHRIVASNKAAQRTYGYSEEEFLGMKPEMLFLEEDRARFLKRYRSTRATSAELAEGKIVTELGWRNRKKDGTPIDVEIYLSSMRWMGGHLWLAMARDVTAQKAAEAAMRDAEEKWRSLVECEMGFVMLVDKDDHITFANHVLPDLDDDVVIGRKVYDFVSPKHREAVRRIMETARHTGEAVALETLGRGPGGTEVWYNTQWVPIKRDGRVISLMCFATDITEQKRIHAELEEAKESAEHASMAKDRFLAILSHELRAPLCPVLAGVSALQEDGKLRPDLQMILAMIQRNIEVEARLIDDLLDMTRIANGKLLLSIDRVNVHAVATQAVDMCRPQADAKQIAITTAFGAEDHITRADPERLRQVFWNLVQNAVKFTPSGGKVHISSMNPAEGLIHVAVSDTGIGIAPEHLPRIFDPFEQVSPFSRRAGGLGLGLSISKALVDAFQGTLEAESTGTGRGAAFSVDLPLVEETVVEAPETETPAARNVERPCRLQILLVEDDDDTRLVLTELLEACDYDVRPARNIAEAVTEVRERPFDLVISDLGLPDGSGLDMFVSLRSIRHLRGIALSGFGMEEDVRRSRSAGFAAHMTKPVTLQALKRTIEEVTSGPAA